MPNYHKKKNRQHSKNNRHGKTTVTDIKETNSDDDPNNSSSIFKVEISDVMGRYLTATKHIKQGEVILEETPLVVGPPTEHEPVCLGCLKSLPPSTTPTFRCPKCRWQLCSPDCPGLDKDNGHSRWECDLFAKKNISEIIENYDSDNLKAAYEIILQIRCLLLKQHDKPQWDKLMEMESHNAIRRDIGWLWQRNQDRVVNRIREEWKIDDFTEEEIHTVCGIIEVNCFEVGQDNSKGRALYPTSFLFAHDCSPSASHTDYPEDFSITIRAMRDIKQGEPITVSYGYVLVGTLQRRQQLNLGKFFWCDCKRCSDPTEFGTYCSALKCSSCSEGLILPTNPLDQDAIWKCLKCPFTMEARTVLLMLDELFFEMDSIDPHDVNGQEAFMKKYQHVLGDNHYFNLSVKYTLCQLYGRSEGFLVDSLTEDQLESKQKYCQDVLDAIKVLEPGLSRVKGIVSYELHVPLFFGACKRLERKQISKNAFLKCVKNVAALLQDSSEILKGDPGTKEQELLHGAETALAALRLQKLL